MATAAQLREALKQFDDSEQIPLDFVLRHCPSDTLSYVESALSDWDTMTEMFGNDFHPEVDEFLSCLRDAL